MTSNRPRAWVAVAVVVAGVLSCWSAASALAQQDSDAPLLSGPRVESVRPERLEQGLTMSGGQGMQMGQMRQLPMADVRGLLEAMAADEADASIRLSADQSESIAGLTREHRRLVRAYRSEHAERIESMRIRGGLIPARLPDDQLSDDQRAARAALYRFYREGPSDADLQAQVFAALSPEQREHLNAEIDRLIEQRSRERRERQYAEALASQPIDPEDLFDASGAVRMELLPDRLRERLSRAPEARRAQILRRILGERAEGRLPSGPAGEAGGESGMSDRPPPSTESIEVPPPA